MKKIYSILVVGLCAMTFCACQDHGWDDEVNTSYTIWNDTITEHNVVTIKSLKNKYANIISASSYKLVEEDIQIKGTVICNDEGGNLSQQLVVTDGTSNIIIGITEDAMYSYVHNGQDILLNLKGLYVGGYGMNGQIGYPSMSSTNQAKRIGRMPRQMWLDHVKLVGTADILKVPDPIAFNSSWGQSDKTQYDTYADKLVYVDGYLSGADGTKKLAENADADAGNAVNVTLTMTGGGSVTIRTSCYSDFASLVMPKGKVHIVGILTPYNQSSWQILMRTADDIKEIK